MTVLYGPQCQLPALPMPLPSAVTLIRQRLEHVGAEVLLVGANRFADPTKEASEIERRSALTAARLSWRSPLVRLAVTHLGPASGTWKRPAAWCFDNHRNVMLRGDGNDEAANSTHVFRIAPQPDGTACDHVTETYAARSLPLKPRIRGQGLHSTCHSD